MIKRSPLAIPLSKTVRQFQETSCTMRSPFQRDRDRIIHSEAFRRLNHKTQVFLYHEGDHYRSRLTHSLEVAQIARSITRMLGIDEDLTEAVALSHDLGHPPFGHAGERALDRVMKHYGGFDHNAQSLKVVTKLEGRYPQFKGLNLTSVCLEAIAKHNGPLTDLEDGNYIYEFNQSFDLSLSRQTCLEGQVAAIADDIAYNNHDIDDGLRAGLISIDQLEDVPLVNDCLEQVRRTYDDLSSAQMIYGVNRLLITKMVEDCVRQTKENIQKEQIKSLEDIYNAKSVLVCFSPKMSEGIKYLREFLFSNVYRSKKIMTVMTNGEMIIEDLFHGYFKDLRLLPDDFYNPSKDKLIGAENRARLVCDYIAGMTDRFAISAHKSLFDHTPELG